MKTNYMGMFRAMNVTYFLHKPKANNAWIERYVHELTCSVEVVSGDGGAFSAR